jgi:hypothetical protein
MPDYYLPIIQANSFLPYMLGAQQVGYLPKYKEWFIPKRVYQWPVRWSEVEKERGVYSWPWNYGKNAEFLDGLGCPVIITVKATPGWAQLWEHAGAPPKPEFYYDFAYFLQAVLYRYHPAAVELYNEPDMERSACTPDNDFYGAWVDDGETFYEGGLRYGECMGWIGSQVTGTKLVVGALTMHSKSVEFLSGAQDAGLGGEALSFHCYVPYTPHNAFFDRPFELARSLREVTSLPLLMTETSLITEEDGSGALATDDFKVAQADYLRSILEHLHLSEIQLVNWYTLANGTWRNSSLIDYGEVKPVYEVWKNA